MFLFAPGFEGAVLKATTVNPLPAVSIEESQRKQLIGFVKFAKPSEALYALETLNGRILDQERGIVIKVEIAKKNLYIKTSPIAIVNDSLGRRLSTNLSDDERAVLSPSPCSCTESGPRPCLVSSCSLCVSTRTDSASGTGGRVMSITLPGQSDPSLISAPEPLKTEMAVEAVSLSPHSSSDRVIDLQRSLIASPDLGSMAAIVGENFPCNTLYVGNLPPIAQEDELRALFRNSLGYRRLSFRPKSSGPMCFVEFEDIACATAAMETLYGTLISCSLPAKGGIRLSFSKNPLGLRVASPISTATINPAYMEAIGAEVDNPNHQQAIATIFTHYYKNNPLSTNCSK